MNRYLRPFSIAVLVLAACAIALTGCGSKSASESASPTEAIQTSLDKTSTITSGLSTIKGALSIGAVPGSIAITGGGPFDTEAKGGAAFDLELSIGIAGTQQKMGFVAVNGKNYMVVGDKAIEQKGENAKGLDGKQIANYIESLGKYISNAKKTGDNTYTADVDMKQLFTDSKKKAGNVNFEIPGLGSLDQLQKSLGTSTLKIEIDSEGYASTIDLNLPITTDGNEGGVRLTISLSEINEPQKIEQPANVVDAGSALGSFGSSVAPR
jgi:hypothetical protein